MKEVNNKNDFMEAVRLDKNGFLLIFEGVQNGEIRKCENAEDFFKNISFDNNGLIKTFK